MWHRFDPETLDALIADEFEACTEAEVAAFKAHQVPLADGLIRHTEVGKLEPVFIVARCGVRVIFYNDVEEGFGVAEQTEELVLCSTREGQWPLGFAVRELTAK